jgi:hypothetical protein
MPYVSLFFGIIIRMFYNDHNPPHFHAEYQGIVAQFDFDGNLIKGDLRSKTARKLIKEWAQMRKDELEENWFNIHNNKEINKIMPLD